MNTDNFQGYLLTKQSVDDRALNKDVLATLKAHLPPAPFSIVEVGAGIGTMPVALMPTAWPGASSPVRASTYAPFTPFTSPRCMVSFAV